MAIESTILFALTVYALAAIISFFVAFLIKGLFVCIRLPQTLPNLLQRIATAPKATARQREAEPANAR